MTTTSKSSGSVLPSVAKHEQELLAKLGASQEEARNIVDQARVDARRHLQWHVEMRTISFTRHRFPPDIIRHAVWLYARFTLSYRDVEDLLAERGLDISYESVRRWFIKFGAPIARDLRRMRPTPSDYWHLDEMVIVIRGRRHWLWRAVDNEGEVLDFLVQSRRNAGAALKLMRKLLKKQGWAPTRITTDKLRS